MKGKKAKFTELRARLHVAQRSVSKRGKVDKEEQVYSKASYPRQMEGPFFLQSNTWKGSAFTGKETGSQEGVTT